MGKVGSRSVQLGLIDAGVQALHKHKFTLIKDPHPTDKYITLTRDPVARNMSAFFAGIKKFFPTIDKDLPDMTTDDFISVFLDRYPVDGYLTWFDDNIKKFLDIDVYEQNFDPEKGFMIVDNLLVIRVEDLDVKGIEGIKEFTGATIKKRRTNRREDWKILGPYYAKTKKECVLPDEFLDKMYSSKYATYFYTTEEIEGFRKQWGK